MKKTKLNNVSKLLLPVTTIALAAGIILAGTNDITAQATGDVPVVTTEDAEALEYRVKFINYDGSELYNELQEYGTIIMSPDVPERVGFTFVGWAPEVDATVPAQDMVYTAQYQQAETSTAVSTTNESTAESNGSVVVYDSEAESVSNNTTSSQSGSNLSEGCEDNHFVHFLFMVIIFMMEIVWLHDRRTQQMIRYDAVMDKVDRE